MTPDLSDRDRERFEDLKERLKGVSRTTTQPKRLDTKPGPLDPMLASSFDGDLAALSAEEWLAERKYDGTRLVLQKFDGEVSIYTRRHVERSETVPGLAAEARSELPDGLVLDGEYAFLNPAGGSRFIPIHTAGDTVEEEDLTRHFFVFDVLVQDHEWCTREPLTARKERLTDIVEDGEIIHIGESENGELQQYYDRLVEADEEGIIIKRRESRYHLGTRSDNWRKVKAVTETDVLAVGYTPGEGVRSDTFGALVMTDGEQYVGRVGSGFDQEELESLLEAMVPVDDRPVPVDEVGMDYTPIEPMVIRIKYQEQSDSGSLRAPVFLHRTEKPVQDVEPLG